MCNPAKCADKFCTANLTCSLQGSKIQFQSRAWFIVQAKGGQAPSLADLSQAQLCLKGRHALDALSLRRLAAHPLATELGLALATMMQQ